MTKHQKSMQTFIILFLGIVASIMVFLPALSYNDSDSTFTGFEVVFGTEFFNLGSFGSGQIEFSILGVIAFISPLAASLIATYAKKGMLIASALFTLAAVLLFTLPAYTTATMRIGETFTEIDINWSMAYGLIIAGILSIFGALFTLLNVLYKNLQS